MFVELNYLRHLEKSRHTILRCGIQYIAEANSKGKNVPLKTTLETFLPHTVYRLNLTAGFSPAVCICISMSVGLLISPVSLMRSEPILPLRFTPDMSSFTIYVTNQPSPLVLIAKQLSTLFGSSFYLM